MKKLLIISFFAISFSASAQQSKSDSLKQIETNKAVDKIITTTPIKEFQEWLYDAVSAKKFNEFMEIYNAFIRIKYEAIKPK